MFAEWLERFGASIMVMDAEGKVLYMNETAHKVFKQSGGKKMVGSNVRQCHQAASMDTIREMIENDSVNVYTIEKNGQKKMVYQAPWYKDDRVAGLVSISLAIPKKIPHYQRHSP